MNSQLRRIIFNLTGSRISGFTQAAIFVTSRSGNPQLPPVTRLTPGLVILLLAFGAAFASDIHPDPSAPVAEQPNILKTANGLPQINIQSPGSDGVSVNQYSRFDVDSRGTIINNSPHNWLAISQPVPGWHAVKQASW